MEDIKYYEIEFTKCDDKDERSYYCILGVRKPTKNEAQDFWGEEKGFHVTDVLEISREEAYRDYEMDEYEQRPNRLIFGIDMA